MFWGKLMISLFSIMGGSSGFFYDRVYVIGVLLSSFLSIKGIYFFVVRVCFFLFYFEC